MLNRVELVGTGQVSNFTASLTKEWGGLAQGERRDVPLISAFAFIGRIIV